MAQPTLDRKSRQTLLAWMIFSDLLALITLYPLIYMGGLALTAFTNMRPADPWTLILATSPCPGVPMLLIIAGWFAYKRRQYNQAAILSGLAFLVPIGLLLLMWASLAWSTTIF